MSPETQVRELKKRQQKQLEKDRKAREKQVEKERVEREVAMKLRVEQDQFEERVAKLAPKVRHHGCTKTASGLICRDSGEAAENCHMGGHSKIWRILGLLGPCWMFWVRFLPNLDDTHHIPGVDPQRMT